MYEAHFGFRRRPFGETVDPSSYVPLPSRESVVRRLRYALEQGQGAALLFGPHGSGKTLIAWEVARQLAAPTAHVTFPAMPAAELFAFLAEEIGAGVSVDGEPPILGPLRRLRQRLSTGANLGERPLLLIDEAHLIDDPATFEALRSLLNFATLGPPDLSLLLVGGAELVLNLPEGLADRIGARCLLPALTESETADYLAGRIAWAGGTSPLFNTPTIRAIHRAAEGLPRRLNRLADLTLLLTFAAGRSHPEARDVEAAARDGDPDAAFLAA